MNTQSVRTDQWRWYLRYSYHKKNWTWMTLKQSNEMHPYPNLTEQFQESNLSKTKKKAKIERLSLLYTTLAKTLTVLWCWLCFQPLNATCMVNPLIFTDIIHTLLIWKWQTIVTLHYVLYTLSKIWNKHVNKPKKM